MNVHSLWRITASLAVGVAMIVTVLPACTAHRGGGIAVEKIRGVNYAHAWRQAEQLGYGSPASAASLTRLKSLGVNWIAITPFGFQTGVADREIRWGSRQFSETDERLRAVTEQAHALGVRVLLKPHLWLRPPAWVGLIEQHSEEGWAAWFAAYRAYILHYAALAADTHMDALCIGNELEKTTVRDREWRSVIHDVRGRYQGPVTYGAGGDEALGIRFWDDLDFIGISAYYPLVDRPEASVADLVAAWRPLTKSLGDLSARWHKPVAFTELGYRSADLAAWKQWEIRRDARVNLQAQADAYAAFFEAVWPQPWFGGVYWWKWFSFPDDGGAGDNDYTPRNKPAELVMQRYFGDHR